jgi:formylmethanofuran dehydrogenase subunit B
MTDGPRAVTHTVHDALCTVCGCVCDDLSLTVEGGRIVRADGACPLAEPWLLKQGANRPPVALIDGREAALDDALDRAADILRRARSPLIYGLSRSNTDGQREAVALGEWLGATVDTTAALGHAPSVMALQEAGESTCTLGEVKNRADLVLFWGSDPVESHPRHLERYSLDPAGLFLPGGRAERTMAVIDTRPTRTAERADLFVRVRPGEDFELLWALRAFARGVEPAGEAFAGVPRAGAAALAGRMMNCRFGVVFFGLGLARGGARTVEALLRLVIELNDHTRFYARRMRVSGDVAGADSVLAWQTGYPFAVSFARGVPRYNPGEFTGPEMLARGEADACLLVGAGGLRRFGAAAREGLARTPTIVLDGPDAEPACREDVRINTAVPGVHAGGTVYRMDEVPLRLRAVLPGPWPSDADVLGRLRQRLTSLV